LASRSSFGSQAILQDGPLQRGRIRAAGKDFKGKVSFVLYGLGTAAAWFIAPWIGVAAFAAVALLWLVPDRRMEAAMARRHTAS